MNKKKKKTKYRDSHAVSSGECQLCIHMYPSHSFYHFLACEVKGCHVKDITINEYRNYNTLAISLVEPDPLPSSPFRKVKGLGP